MHAAIRENPAAEKKERSKPSETKNWKAKKLTYDERKQKLKVRSTTVTSAAMSQVSAQVLHGHKPGTSVCRALSVWQCVSLRRTWQCCVSRDKQGHCLRRCRLMFCAVRSVAVQVPGLQLVTCAGLRV